MKAKRILATALASTLAVAMLGGCTGGGGGSTGSTPTPGSSNNGGGKSGDVQEITFMVWDDLETSEDLITKGYADSIARFNKDFEGKYHAKVVSTNLEQYYDKLNAEVTAKTCPDVFIVSPGANMDDYVLTGTAAKLDDYLAKDGWKQSFTSDAVFAGGTYGDEAKNGAGIYGIPLNIAAACVFYNTEMFKDAGAEVPKTYDELLDACEKLQAKGYTPITISASTAWCLSMVAGYLCDRNGLDLDDINSKDHKTDWYDAKVIKAGEQIQELSKYFQKTAAGDNNDVATANFYNGEAAILIQGSWAIGQINGSCKDESFPSKVGVFAFPAVSGSSADPNRVIAKSDSLAMSNTTKYPEASIALMKYFVDDTAQKYTAEKGGKIPVTKVEYSEKDAPPELAYVMDVFKSANATFGFYNESLATSEAGSTFDDCFVDIFTGTDPKTALEPIQKYYEENVWNK